MIKILLIEDHNVFRQALADLLTRRGFEVFDAPDGASALRLAPNNHWDIVLCDIALPDMDGYRLLEEIPRLTTYAKWFFMTGNPIDMLTLQATHGEVADYIIKPFDMEKLLTIIQA